MEKEDKHVGSRREARTRSWRHRPPRALEVRFLCLCESTAHGLRRLDVFAAKNKKHYYTLDLGVGTPPTNYTLPIDMGSSNTVTFVSTSKPFCQPGYRELCGK